MYGILAAVSHINIVQILVEGLKRLEYRCYCFDEIAVLGQGNIARIRSVGRVVELETASAGGYGSP